MYMYFNTALASWWSQAVAWRSFRGQYSFTLIPFLLVKHCGPQPRCDQLEKEVHLLWATRTTQTWQRSPALPPALPYAHLCAHLQKSPASCSVCVPGWIKPIGSTPRCVSGCVPLLKSILLAFLGGTSDKMSKSPLAVLWFRKKEWNQIVSWLVKIQFWLHSFEKWIISWLICHQRSKCGFFMFLNICSIYVIYVHAIWKQYEILQWQICHIYLFFAQNKMPFIPHA